MLLNVCKWTFDVPYFNLRNNKLLISNGEMIPLTMTAVADEEHEETPLWHGLPSINILFSCTIVISPHVTHRLGYAKLTAQLKQK